MPGSIVMPRFRFRHTRLSVSSCPEVLLFQAPLSSCLSSLFRHARPDRASRLQTNRTGNSLQEIPGQARDDAIDNKIGMFFSNCRNGYRSRDIHLHTHPPVQHISVAECGSRWKGKASIGTPYIPPQYLVLAYPVPNECHEDYDSCSGS